MTSADKNFYTLCRTILDSGSTTQGEKVRPSYSDGQPSHTLYVTQIFETYDLEKGDFPLVTLRPIPWKMSVKEIFWIYQDQSNDLSFLAEKYNIHWWNEWDVGNGTIGQRYGATVKRYDLINQLLQGLKDQPLGRRHIINLYQYADFEETNGLYPCAMETHWAVRGNLLDLTLIQRSSDVPVANSINKIQYVALQMMVARHCGLEIGRFCHYVHNAHIYHRHIPQVKELIRRYEENLDAALSAEKQLPRLILNPDKKDFYTFTLEDFTLENYEPIKPNLTFEMAI